MKLKKTTYYIISGVLLFNIGAFIIIFCILSWQTNIVFIVITITAILSTIVGLILGIIGFYKAKKDKDN